MLAAVTRRTACKAAALATLGAFGSSRAAGYPDRPITLIYNFAPGGPGDAIARFLAQSMGSELGQQIVVENRTGGSGVIGILAAARAAADGYTLLYTPVTGVVQVPLVTKDASFSPLRSLTPILRVGRSPLALYVHPSVPASDMRSWIEWARGLRDGADVGGAGPITEVSMALLGDGTGLKLVYVPFRGAAPATQAVLSGDVKSLLAPPSGATAQYVATGKLKAIAVTSAEVSALLPGVGPIGDVVPGYVQEIDFVLWGPAGLGRDVVSRLRATATKVLREPGVDRRFLEQGLIDDPRDGAEVRHIIEREDATIRKAIEQHGIKFS